MLMFADKTDKRSAVMPERHKPHSSSVLALFDLDHTILDIDSDHAWGEYLVKKGLVDEASYRTANQAFYEQYVAGTLDATEYNEFVAQFLASLPLPELCRIRADYLQSEILPHVRPQALNAMRWHQEQGHDVVIISATNDFVVSVIADAVGVSADKVLATPLEICNERYTGKLTDKPNFQTGKLYHLQKWLDTKAKKGITFDKTYAYSDSKNDLPLLKWADVPVCITPDDVLQAHALAHGWAVEDWSI